MFGYIKPHVPELKVKDHEFYRAVYCGLCRAMGKTTGQLSRFTLNYDFVFLCAVLLIANGEPFEIKRGRCIAHPIKARAYVENNETLSRAASLSALLVYHKVRDDASDEKGFKKIAAHLALPFLAHAKKRANNPALLEEKVKEKLDALSALEKENPPSPEPVAALFGELLGEIARAGLIVDSDALSRILYAIGYHTGRWIYAIDALDDIESDQKRLSYNPYLLSFGGVPQKDELGIIEHSLILELEGLERAIALLDMGEREPLRDIIENILYLGLPEISKKTVGMEIK